MGKQIDLQKILVSVAQDLYAPPSFTMSLYDAVFGEQDKWRERVEAVRAEKDSEKQTKMKEQLPTFTPSGLFMGLKDIDLIKHSGYIAIDIDQKDNPAAKNFGRFKEIISAVPHVAFCAKSCRGNGYYCLIPIAKPQLHREYFKSLQADFSRCNVKIDSRCINVGHRRFVSFDPEPYINLNAKVYDRVLSPKPNPYRLKKNSNSMNTSTTLIELKNLINERKVDITGGYNQWFSILCGIANELGAAGEEFAHEISQYSPTYNYEDTSKTYKNIIKYNYTRTTISTLFYYARLNGVELKNNNSISRAQSMVTPTETPPRRRHHAEPFFFDEQGYFHFTRTEEQERLMSAKYTSPICPF